MKLECREGICSLLPRHNTGWPWFSGTWLATRASWFLVNDSLDLELVTIKSVRGAERHQLIASLARLVEYFRVLLRS